MSRLIYFRLWNESNDAMFCMRYKTCPQVIRRRALESYSQRTCASAPMSVGAANPASSYVHDKNSCSIEKRKITTLSDTDKEILGPAARDLNSCKRKRKEPHTLGCGICLKL